MTRDIPTLKRLRNALAGALALLLAATVWCIVALLAR